jgi:hypothetical protein
MRKYDLPVMIVIVCAVVVVFLCIVIGLKVLMG